MKQNILNIFMSILLISSLTTRTLYCLAPPSHTMAKNKVAFSDEIANIIKKLVFPRITNPKNRIILGYPGNTISKLQISLMENGLNVIRPAPNEFTLADVAFGLSQMQGIAVISVTHGVGVKPVLAEMGKFINERRPVIILAGGPSENAAEDKLHALTSPSSSVSNRESDIRMAKALGIPSFDIKIPVSGVVSDSLASQFHNAVITAFKKQKPVLIIIRAETLDMVTEQAPVLFKPIQAELSPSRKAQLKRKARQVYTQITQSNNPALYVGEGVPRHLAELVEEISTKFGVYTTITWGAKGLIREDIPTYGGIYQGELTTELPKTKAYMESADFVLRLGNRKIPLYIETGIGTRRFPKNTISIEPSEHYSSGQDIKYFLDELLTIGNTKGFKKRKINSRNSFFKQILTTDIESLKNAPIVRSCVHQILGYFNTEISKKKLTYIIDPGTSWFPGIYMPTKGRNSIISNWTYGELGVSAGQAMGISLSGRIPVVLIGDGAYIQKGENILSDFIRLKKHAIFIIFKNNQLAMGLPSDITLKSEQAIYRLDNVQTNFTDVAKAKGALTYEVRTNDELIKSLKTAEKNKGVHVIVVPIKDNTRDTPYPLRILYSLASRAKNTSH